jgi:hypothetical protein
MRILALSTALALLALTPPTVATGQTTPAPKPAPAAENFLDWSLLRPTFPSTGGNDIMIKGYDPHITGNKCVTTFMAVEPGKDGAVYFNVVEFDAVPAQGGILCTNGRWRAFDNSAQGTTPFRVFFKDGVFRGSPM